MIKFLIENEVILSSLNMNFRPTDYLLTRKRLKELGIFADDIFDDVFKDLSQIMERSLEILKKDCRYKFDTKKKRNYLQRCLYRKLNSFWYNTTQKYPNISKKTKDKCGDKVLNILSAQFHEASKRFLDPPFALDIHEEEMIPILNREYECDIVRDKILSYINCPIYDFLILCQICCFCPITCSKIVYGKTTIYRSICSKCFNNSEFRENLNIENLSINCYGGEKVYCYNCKQIQSFSGSPDEERELRNIFETTGFCYKCLAEISKDMIDYESYLKEIKK